MNPSLKTIARMDAHFAAKLNWWSDEVTAFGQRVDQHQADIDAAIDRIDAMLADWRAL